MTLDSSSNVYLTGETSSDNFPTKNPMQANKVGGESDAFVTKINETGSSLVYSTYLGGSFHDRGEGITVDSSGNAYVTGYTSSEDFPTQNAIQSNKNGPSDCFVTKINTTGTALVYSTYLGGSSFETQSSIAVDSFRNAYVTGMTDSQDFPTQNAIQSNKNGPGDCFVTKINTTGTALVYSTYLGGSGGEDAYSIEVDTLGNAYITGRTTSDDFPTRNPLQSTKAGGSGDAFVTKINSLGTDFVYSTYLGGSGDLEWGNSIEVDSSGNAYVTGSTNSTDFPMHNPIQADYAGGGWLHPFGDAFVTKINTTGTALIYSTYLGGSGGEDAYSIAVDTLGNAYITGETVSTDFPTHNPLQPNHAGNHDAFVTKIGGSNPAPDIKTNGSDGPVSILKYTNLSVTISLDPGSHVDENADWWVLANTPMGWYHYVLPDSWAPGQAVTHQGVLFDLPSYEVLNMSGLPTGTYTFYFGVDLIMNGSIDPGQLYYDSVEVTIN